jgi:hypothetical protein
MKRCSNQGSEVATEFNYTCQSLFQEILQQEFQNIPWEIRRCALLLGAARETAQGVEKLNATAFIAMPFVQLETQLPKPGHYISDRLHSPHIMNSVQ